MDNELELNGEENNNEIKPICKKTSFLNEGIATQYIKKLQATSIRDRVPQRAYLCEKCLNWHLTSKPDYSDIKIEKLKSSIQDLQNELIKREIKIEDITKRLESAYEMIYKLRATIKNQ